MLGWWQAGHEAAKLAMRPLLALIVERLQRAAAGGGSLVSLFSGHDTVIAPILSVLGVMAEPSLCGWPPYASHLVFELYQPRWSGAVPAAPRRAADASVRVVYNGRAVTHLVAARASRRAGHEPVDLCPLRSLARLVRNIDPLSCDHDVLYNANVVA